MKEQLEPVFVRSKQKIEYGDDKYTPAQLLSQRINNQREQGWWFPAGDPEFWKFSDKLLIKGGKALDLGLGFGKSAFFFAINGMNVTGYETSQPAIKVVKSLKQIFNLPIEIKEEDFAAADLGKNIYDTVFLAQTLVHSPSEEAAFELINKAIKALKPCGRIWIRTSGIYDGALQELKYYSMTYPEITYIADNLYLAPCSCSGEWKVDPQLFLDPMEVAGFLAKNRMELEHTNLGPNEEVANIIFGEDWNPDSPRKNVYNFITIIAKKPFA